MLKSSCWNIVQRHPICCCCCWCCTSKWSAQDQAQQTQHLKSIRLFDFRGLETWVYPGHNYDGDTLHLALAADRIFSKRFINSHSYFANQSDQYAKVAKIRVRLADIDTPELKKTSGREKAHALRAKEALKRFVGHQPRVWCVFGNQGKYRPLVTLYQAKGDTESINTKMLRSGMGVSYDGGKKQRIVYE